jgi:GTP-binding protein EngB required for normal cell division
MKLSRGVRLLIAMGITVLGLAALLLLLTLGETTLTIHTRLAAAGGWAQAAFWGALGLFGALIGTLLWRLLRPSREAASTGHTSRPPPAPTEEELTRAIKHAETLGADTGAIRRELDELQGRRGSGTVHIALFGEISTGKSSLVNALLPGVEAASDVRGGTTRELKTYRWQSPGGDSLLLTDMPGTGEANGQLDQVAIDEAKRAHVVLYIADGDLNRHQHQALRELLLLEKPLILVLNKTDRYSAAEIEQLARKLNTLLEDHPSASLVQVSAASHREVIRQLPDGSETREKRPVAPRIAPLAAALQRQLDEDPEALAALRDSATFVLVQQKLDQALAEVRLTKAEKIVDAYAVKAVVGALAAVTPGTDLLIQGWLGTQLIRELAALYEVRVGKVDADLLLQLVQKHVGRRHTLLLAVAGNALKAFPGVGTLAGGALHAVAYGIIFRTLGRALTTSLATRGELHPRQTAKLFEDKLGETLETSAQQAARLVAAQTRADDKAGR